MQLKLRLLKRLGLSKHHSKSEIHQHHKDHQNQTTNTQCNVMNIKWATLTVGALFGFAHIGILGHILTKPQYPEIKFPDGDYSSFTVKSGKDGYQIEYKANDPAILESNRSLSVDKRQERIVWSYDVIYVVNIVEINIRWMGKEISEVNVSDAEGKNLAKSEECIRADAGARSQGAMAGTSIAAGVAVPAVA